MKPKRYTWPLWLARAIAENAVALLFVIVILVVFRMPHLSDLTVVIIQLDGYGHWFVMIAFFVSIYTMALLISYGNLLRTDPDDAAYEEFSNLPKIQRIKLRFKNLTSLGLLQDTQERNLMKYKYGEKSQDEDASPNADNTMPDESPEAYVQRLYPKLLGVFMILGIAFSVNNTYAVLFNRPIVPSMTFILISLVLLALTHPRVGHFLENRILWKKESKIFPLIIAGIALVVILVLGSFNDGGNQSDIRNLFWSIVCLGTMFLMFSLTYNKGFLMFKRKFALWGALPIITFVFGMYLVILCSPQLDKLKGLTPIVILMICLIGIFLSILLLKYAGRILEFPLLAVMVAVFVLFTFINAGNKDFKHFEVSNTHSVIDPDDRMDLDAYVQQWIDEREALIKERDTANRFPIIMVSAEGGGSRAGHWAFLTHSYLYEKSESYYKTHLFSTTGASGGSVGSNLFHALAYEYKDAYQSNRFLVTKDDRPKDRDSKFLFKGSTFYQGDFISSSIAGLLGRDILASVFNLKNLKDRGEITELEWERQCDSVFGINPLNKPYLHIIPKTGAAFTPPLMVTNSAHVQTGRLYIMSPVKFEPNNHNEMVFQDLLEAYAANYPGCSLKRSSAMLLSARFPYLSPNGRIDGVGQFGDAGYYDNIGSVVTKRLEKALNKALKKRPELDSLYNITHLIIRNNVDTPSPECEPCNCSDEDPDYISQLISPLVLANKTSFAPPDEFIDSYPEDFRIESKRTLIPIHRDSTRLKSEDTCKTQFKPLIPLGRYMSDDALKSLEMRLFHSEVKPKLDTLIKRMNK